MGMSYQTLQFGVEKGVANIMFARPEQANTLTPELIDELKDVVARCDQDDDIRAVVLSAAPGPFFCAGGDLGKFLEAGDKLSHFMEEMLEDFHPTMELLACMDAPVVAAVDGVTAGIGFSFVLCSSFCIVSPNANFTMAYTGAGLTPDGGASFFLPKIVGLRRAEELMITNRTLSAEEAVEWGIANQVVPQDQLMASAQGLAYKLANGPTKAFGNVRRLLIDSFSNDLSTQLHLEGKSIARMGGSPDGQEGIRAFLEKRTPRFTGRF